MGPWNKVGVALYLLFVSGLLEGTLGYSSQQSSYDDSLKGRTFDFIVVGAGTGGCAVAGRLAESGKHTVLLIEAGGIPHPNLNIPALRLETTAQNPNLSKAYQSVQQTHAALARNGIVNILRGQTLGGGSAINGEVLNRGSPHDFDNWAKLTGDDSWKYANMLKYFKKSESYAGDYPSDQRGFNGPIPISRPRFSPGVDQWFQAGQELGYRIAEPNGPQVVSFTPQDYTREHGRRVSSYHGYIEPLLLPQAQSGSFQSPRKNNLLILINTRVKRILFEGKRAVGVKFTTGNLTENEGYARATKEIIVSAGGIDSPVLLMKSGIGPKSVLEASGISPVKYLPVGRNLHDHSYASLVVAFGNRSAALDVDSAYTPAAWREYLDSGDGPYSSDMGIHFQAFLTTSALSPRERRMGWADLQLHPFNSNIRSGMWERDQVRGLRDTEISVPWPVFVSRPKSRGFIALNQTDIEGNPLIDFKYLTDPYDVRVLVEGLKISAKLCQDTVAYQRIGCRLPSYPVIGCSHLRLHSDPYWECYGRHFTSSGFHTAGTCRMGKGAEDPEAVVDSKLRVIDVKNLLVIDASIMPTITNGNLMGPIYAIAEKASEMILKKWEGGILSSHDINAGIWSR